VSLSDVKLDGLEKVEGMEGWFGDDFIGLILAVLIHIIHVDAD
jgi:hypothetical protein